MAMYTSCYAFQYIFAVNYLCLNCGVLLLDHGLTEVINESYIAVSIEMSKVRSNYNSFGNINVTIFNDTEI